jgi:hypothetical protein
VEYQFVIQFSREIEIGLDQLISLENELEEILPIDTEIDGHDIGYEQMNIFILTNKPYETFMKIKSFFEGRASFLSKLKMAYRDIQQDEFVVLWPPGLKDFQIT